MDNSDTIINKINIESKKIKYTELYGNDIIFTTVAIVITIIISIYFIILINFKKYHKAWKDNENNIRCNPVFMPFSKYISTGPLFGNPISGSENLNYCVNNISVNVSADYSTDFTGVFKNIDIFYNLITDSIITLKLMFASLIRLFAEVTKVMMKRFNILSSIITSLIDKVIITFNIFPTIFMVVWNIVLEFINIIKYILICLVNLLYKCVLGPVASLVEMLTIWGVLIIVFMLISLLMMFSSMPFGPWPFFLGATILFAVLMVILMPISYFIKVLFIILLTIINKINEKVLTFLLGIDTGMYINTVKYDNMRSAYIIKKENEGRKNLFSPPNFDDCKKIFKKN
tara:strand:+ start:6363 stop:7394 length:1032 start_codon:yes stop_codon:yes gene_type:complete